MRKNIITGLFCLLILAAGTDFGIASEGGARPISLGGAYVALSDDVHAASWNPAGLAWQEHKEAAYSGIINNREDCVAGDFVSDDYAAYAQPLTINSGSYGGAGIYLHRNFYEDDITRAKTALWQPGLAYGRKFSEIDNMSWGASLNFYYFDSEIPGTADEDTAISLNLGYLWYITESLTFGFLWENVNEPEFALHGVNSLLVRVFRPGIAYYFSEQSVITLDIYDLTGNTDGRGNNYSQNIRIGFEHYFMDSLSGRFGVHHPNSDVETSQYYSAGISWQRSDFFNTAPVNYYLDYTFIYWPEMASGMDDFTHQVGISVKF